MLQIGSTSLPARPRTPIAALIALVAFGALLLVPTLDWGVVSRSTLAVDEISPMRMDAAREAGFAHGWHDYYPPVAFYAAHLADRAAAALDSVRGVEADPGRRLNLAMRAVSLAATLATAVVLLVLALGAVGARSAWVAPLLWLASPTVGYYARTSNVEALYVLFLALALLLLERAAERRSALALGAAALAGALAAATKDQAALFALAAGAGFLLRAGRRESAEPGASSPLATLGLGRVALVALVALGAYALLLGLPWNASGVAAHFASLREVAEIAPEYEESVAGKLAQLVPTAANLVFIVGLPATLLALAGATAIVRRAEPRRAHLIPLVAALGYAALLWLAVPRSYERFLIPAALAVVLLATEGARVVHDLLRPRWLATALVGLVLVHAVARGVELALRLANDSRVLVADTVAADGGAPETTWVLGREVWSSLAGARVATGGAGQIGRRLDRDRPRHLIVEAAQLALPRWRQEIEDAGYDEIARSAGPVPVVLTRIGRARTNLDKLSPELVVFRRRSDPGSRSVDGAETQPPQEDLH